MRLARVILLICFYMGVVSAGMECPISKKDSIFDQVAGQISSTCPRPLIDSSEKSYCCVDIQRDVNYCCDVEEFAKTGLTILIPVIIGAAVIFGLIVGCISCLCCSCCPWYRRRHRGTVYGIQPPVVQVIQPQVNPPSYPNPSVENIYISPYSTNSTGMPQPPPPYTNEAYAKQAPYNPTYPASQSFQS